jgi:hypothetical protein
MQFDPICQTPDACLYGLSGLGIERCPLRSLPQGTIRRSTAERDMTMPTFTNISLVTALILSAGSAASASPRAVASNNYDSPDWAPVHVSPRAAPCPTLEGYPDCHPDSDASWGAFSASRRRPEGKQSTYQRRP